MMSERQRLVREEYQAQIQLVLPVFFFSNLFEWWIHKSDSRSPGSSIPTRARSCW